MLMNTGQGLAIEKNLSKFDVKVLAAETRKQVLYRIVGYLMHTSMNHKIGRSWRGRRRRRGGAVADLHGRRELGFTSLA